MTLCDFFFCRGKSKIFLGCESSTENWISLKKVEKNRFPSFFPKKQSKRFFTATKCSTALSSNLMLVEKSIASNCNEPQKKIEKP